MGFKVLGFSHEARRFTGGEERGGRAEVLVLSLTGLVYQHIMCSGTDPGCMCWWLGSEPAEVKLVLSARK
jgi:hypothetical protein